MNDSFEDTTKRTRPFPFIKLCFTTTPNMDNNVLQKLLTEQETLEPEMAAVLSENLWDLYQE